MDNRFNTIAGWTLFAGIVALGSSIASGMIFEGHRPEKMGYPIEGVEEGGEGGKAEEPIEAFIAKADPVKGEQVFKKCAACHNADQGGANALGPGLFGAMGGPIAKHPGFAYSPALAGVGGNWDWQKMNDWLANPKKFAPGNKMTFAGLGNPEERANLMAFLNTRTGAPLPPPAVPAAPAGGEAAAPGATKPADKAAAEAAGAGAEKAPNQPVLTEQQAAQGGAKNVGGEGASKLTGPAGEKTLPPKGQ